MTGMITQETQRASYIDLALLVAWELLKDLHALQALTLMVLRALVRRDHPLVRRFDLRRSGLELKSHTYASDRKEDMEIYDNELCRPWWESVQKLRTCDADSVCWAYFVSPRYAFLQAL